MRSATSASRSDPATQPDVGHERLPGSTGLAIPALLLFASGATALIYQVLWIKQLSLVVGVDVYAVTTGVSDGVEIHRLRGASALVAGR